MFNKLHIYNRDASTIIKISWKKKLLQFTRNTLNDKKCSLQNLETFTLALSFGGVQQ